MDEIDVLTLPDDLFSDNSWVGPNTDGTYSAPAASQPNNQAWDTSGQKTGSYSDAMRILTGGIAAYNLTQQRIIANDYRSYQATAGGLFQVGQPSPMAAASAAQGPRLNGTGLLLLAGIAYLFLK